MQLSDAEENRLFELEDKGAACTAAEDLELQELLDKLYDQEIG